MSSIVKRAGFLMRETWKEWSEDGASSIAASLAYYTIFSLSPLLIIIALFLGLVLDEATIQTSVIDSVRGAVGDSGAQFMRDLIRTQQGGHGELAGTLVWLGVIVWGASGLFAQLQSALNKIWEVKPIPGRSPTAIVKARMFSFIIVMLVGVVLLTTMLSNTALSATLQNTPDPNVGILIRPLQFTITMAMTTFLIAAVYKILPDVIIRWRDLWVGSLFTAFLFFVGQFVVGQYLSRVNVGSVFGAAGSLTAILVWIYYSAQIFLFGAEFTEVWARHHGAYIRPDGDATWINEVQARREAAQANVAFDETDLEEHKTVLYADQMRRRNERLKRVASASINKAKPKGMKPKNPEAPKPE